MNIFELANIKPSKNVYIIRQERIKREGSQYYTWIVPVTATTATSYIYIPDQFPDSKKYSPLDWMEIVNNETACDLTLTLNGDETLPVPSGVIRKVEGKSLISLAVTNLGLGNTTLNKIIVSLRKQPMTIDRWAQRQ
jgi:hypothetical protein